MHRHVLTGLLLLMAASCLAIPLPAEGDYDINYVLSNLTALWEEVAKLRHEVEDHRQGYPPHNQVTQEVDTLQHEMLVHAYQRPHEGHNDHHNPHALQHLEHIHEHHHEDHNHHDGDDHKGHDHSHEQDDHHHGGGHGHGHHHGHTHGHQHDNDNDNESTENISREDDDSDDSGEAHDHDGHEHQHGGHGHHHHHQHHGHQHHGGHKNHNHGKGHDHSGDTHSHRSHDHSKDTHQHNNDRHQDHDHTGETHDHEGHDHSQDHSENGEGHDHSGDVHNHEGHDHSQDAHQHDNDHHHHDDHHHHHHEKDAHDTHGLHDHFEGAPPPASRPSLVGPVLAPKLGLALAPGREQAGDQGEEWVHASCKLEPNAEMAGSTVRGSVIISQKKDESGPVFFHLDLQGFQPSQGRTHGFHIHSSPITDNKCSTAGGHFNPYDATHGGPHSGTRHVGDLGNIQVDRHGYLENHLLTDDHVAFSGPANIVAKSIVIHAGEDDLGLGGDSGSLTTGNAGGRLACCTIHIQAEGAYRFKG